MSDPKLTPRTSRPRHRSSAPDRDQPSRPSTPAVYESDEEEEVTFAMSSPDLAQLQQDIANLHQRTVAQENNSVKLQQDNDALRRKLKDTEDQLQNLSVGTGGGVTRGGNKPTMKAKEPMTLSTTDPSDFRIFKRNILDCMEMNQWTKSVAVLQLRTSVRDKAAKALEHITFDDTTTLKTALDAYAAVICNPSGSDLAREKFYVARRKNGETIQEWHTRLRTLFLEGFPEEQDHEHHVLLRDTFVMCLQDKGISARLRAQGDFHSKKYSELMVMAQTQQATNALMKSFYPSTTGGVHQLGEDWGEQGSINAFEGNCYGCGQYGHTRAECPQGRNTKGWGEKNSSPSNRNNGGNNSNRFRSNMNGGNPQGRGANRGRPNYRQGGSNGRGRGGTPGQRRIYQVFAEAGPENEGNPPQDAGTEEPEYWFEEELPPEDTQGDVPGLGDTKN